MTVFISYSSKDEAAVREVVRDLELARIAVWLDRELRGGDPWWQDILRQIRECQVFVFALSANSLASKPCRAELAYARALGLPILPVQIGPVENIRATPVADIQVVDYRERTANSGIALIAAIQDAAGARGPLPEPLPASPPVPFEYLLRLGVALEANTLTPDQQGDLLRQLRDCLETEEDDGVLQDARGLLQALRRRPDVTHRSVVEIDALLESSTRRQQVHAGAGRGTTNSEAGQARQATAPPAPPPRQEAPPRPAAPTTPPGWYADPHGAAGILRYWDGRQWTGQTRQQFASPMAQSGSPGGNGYSIAAFVLGGAAVLLYPLFFLVGPAGIVCAVVAKSRGERSAIAALWVAIGGTVVGLLLLGALYSSNSYIY